MRFVHRQMEVVLADFAGRLDESGHQSRFRCHPACAQGDDADEKDRHRCYRGDMSRLTFLSSRDAELSAAMLVQARIRLYLALVNSAGHLKSSRVAVASPGPGLT